MLQVARLAPDLLSEAGERVIRFLHDQFTEEGGARDRAGRTDLYYTVFALEGLIAMRQDPPVPNVRLYLQRFGDGDGLDAVHLACLARCWAALPRGSLNPDTARRLASRIEAYRAQDGGYAPQPRASDGTVYHTFLAFGALQDMGIEIPNPEALARSVLSLQLEGGAFANERGIRAGSTPTTAAAVTLLRNLNAPIPPAAGEWLLRRAHPKGGFIATEQAPLPDLLSTATALHALAGMHVPFGHLKDESLDFLDTLWTGRSFCGSWADDVPDCEYTYYALLSLGHLSLA
ncbi:MAG: terpene cyclase/mutase family protein [Planctomycetes bacterium]|nr:terpene cyclase/mutase family protein [Planctomycetota bacterium]